MQINRSKHLICTVGIILLFFLGFVLPSIQAGFTTYPNDGIWQDTFSDDSNVHLKNCVWKNNEIVLNQTISRIPYNFTQNTHSAYAYQTFFFFPFGKIFSPKTHLTREIPFGRNDLERIKTINREYANRSSSNIRRYVVHHFRLKIDINAETVGNINIQWNGRADRNAIVSFYYWNASHRVFGGWQSLGKHFSNGSDSTQSFVLYSGAAKYALEGDNYLDISVVAHMPSLKSCILSTDFIGLLAWTTKGYTLQPASAITIEAIDPTNISKYSSFYWELFRWDASQPTGTDVRFHVLYLNKSGRYDLVQDSVLPYNHRGFNVSPVSLHTLSKDEYGATYNKLKIRANLSTTSPSVSPRIFSWALTWQNKSRWQDSFNTFYRIDQRTRVAKEGETITISLIQDEWPLFGFNAENTRASDCVGAATNNLYWFSKDFVGGGFRNPVIGDGKIYILSDKRSLYQYDVVLTSGSKEGDPQLHTAMVSFDYDVVNSPAVTDELVIVATGQQASGGSENRIYAYRTNNLSLRWEYPYGQKICYHASPVVVGDTIYISTWGGDNGKYVNEKNRYTNNKLLALNLDSGEWRWEYPLPAPSYSTPAVTTDMIVVGCGSSDNYSVIALSHTGEPIWGKSLGSVGHASPVVSDTLVFVTCKQVVNKKTLTKIIALSRNDGAEKWNATVSETSKLTENLVESTPALYDGILYVAAPDGRVHALYASNGTTRWSTQVYPLPFRSSNVLWSSPAYADGKIYVGTPAGKVCTINAATGAASWEFETFYDYNQPVWKPAPVLGSPVVSNGLVFIADENGVLYSLGKFTTSTKVVTGRIVSVPIRLPQSLWWNSFYADVQYNTTLSSITFTVLDESGMVLKDNLKNNSALTLGDRILNRTIRLQADFTAQNLTKDNPKLLRWYVTLFADTQKPFLDSSSFTPDPKGWLPEIVPAFTIKVKDNITGLQVRSARYELEYTLNNVTQKTSAVASCTGENGTRDWQLMTMDISELPFFDNISALRSIMFSITDLAGNTATKTVTFKQDVKKPTSIIKTQTMKSRYNSTYILINATANDTGILNVDASGIQLVELYYRYSQTNAFSGDWIFFADSTRSSPTWRFNFTTRPSQNGGFFELCTRAIDNASNMEDFPSKGDVVFVYDWKKPSLPSFSGDTLWFNERPQFSVIFEDDFRLHTIQYRPNFENVWTTIASNVNSSIYNTNAVGRSWTLKQEYWDLMVEDEVYYLYFKINDTLGNTRLVTSNTEAIIIRKDISPPIINVEIPSVTTEWTWADNFTVSGLVHDRNGSGIKEASLFYRFSEDKENWSSWVAFGDPVDSSPFEWFFKAAQGDGHYEVKVNVIDYAGNVKESEVFSIAIASFPMTLAVIMVGLVVVLLIIIAVVVMLWRKRT